MDISHQMAIEWHNKHPRQAYPVAWTLKERTTGLGYQDQCTPQILPPIRREQSSIAGVPNHGGPSRLDDTKTPRAGVGAPRLGCPRAAEPGLQASNGSR